MPINLSINQNNTIMKTYNGLTLNQIKMNFPPNMSEVHKLQYLNNCKQVIKNEASGFNLDYNEALRNYNFNLIRFYNAT